MYYPDSHTHDTHMTRAASPTPSASGSILSTTTSRIKGNFWDFDAYSRSFLHERKLIEREKEEWEKGAAQRREIITTAIDGYTKKSEDLKAKSESCLERFKDLSETYRSHCLSLQEEIDVSRQKVDSLLGIQEYFQKLNEILKAEEEQEEFVILLVKQEWKLVLTKIVQLIDMKSELKQRQDTDNSHMYYHVNELINGRLEAFNSVLEKRIRTLIDGLGWPKIVSNSETAEIISRLQELLTYGEAIYILKGTEVASTNHQHPMEYFIDPIRIRFNYHFDSEDRPTNQISRPDWYFDHLLTILRENVAFLKEFIFPCWRLRDFDDFLRQGPVLLAREKTRKNLSLDANEEEEQTSSNKQKILISHLVEFGKFKKSLQEEYGYFSENDSDDDLLFQLNEESFIKEELKRIKEAYANEIESHSDSEASWISPNLIGKDPIAGDPGPIVLKFLSLFNSATIFPYSFINNLGCKARLLARVQSWLLEKFHDKCQFDCSPQAIRKSENEILKDIAMINSLLILSKVLRDDFGESMEYVELSASKELHELIGYDPSGLPGTCFNRGVEAFNAISSKLSGQVFNFVMDGFLNSAITHSNSMFYAKLESSEEAVLLPQNLRLAMGKLMKSLEFIQPLLAPHQFQILFCKTLPEKLAAFMYQGLLLKNFFTQFGAERFCLDLQFIQDSLMEKKASFHLNPIQIKTAFLKVSEAAEILKIREKDPTGPFDGARLAKSVKEAKFEELKRFLELMRWNHLCVDDLAQLFASRRHI